MKLRLAYKSSGRGLVCLAIHPASCVQYRHSHGALTDNHTAIANAELTPARPTDRHGFQVGARPPARREKSAQKRNVFLETSRGPPQVCRGAGSCSYGSIGVFTKNFWLNFRKIGVDAGASSWDILARNWVKGPGAEAEQQRADGVATSVSATTAKDGSWRGASLIRRDHDRQCGAVKVSTVKRKAGKLLSTATR